MENISHLLAIPVDRHRQSRSRTDAKPCQPALILHPELPRTINAGLTKNQGSHAVDPRVIKDILIACAFGTSIRRIGIERPILRYSPAQTLVFIPAVPFHNTQIGHFAVYLVSRTVDYNRA